MIRDHIHNVLTVLTDLKYQKIAHTVFHELLFLLYLQPGPPREFVGSGANLECGALVYKYFGGDLGACRLLEIECESDFSRFCTDF